MHVFVANVTLKLRFHAQTKTRHAYLFVTIGNTRKNKVYYKNRFIQYDTKMYSFDQQQKRFLGL